MKIAFINSNDLDYNRQSPFHPSIKYPEYPFEDTSLKNDVYDSIRNLLYKLEMDREHYNTKYWNPLGSIIKPGMCVLIKPNLVRDYNPNGGTDELITHGSIIRAVLDYCFIALKGKGEIIIGDAPLQNANFSNILNITGIDIIKKYYNENSNVKVNIIDFRKIKVDKNNFGTIQKYKLNGDPLGYTPIDLKADSELSNIKENYEKFRVTNYSKYEMIKHHNLDNNEYLIPNSVLKSDVIINLPKLKTHRKTGFTCALKNLIGINGSKDWLPHHRKGSIDEGGDEYLNSSLRKRILTKLIEKSDESSSIVNILLERVCLNAIRISQIIKPYNDKYTEGSWYGNDTIPRTICDINKIVFYADHNGILRNNIQRKMFIIVDGIIAGENEGPVEPNPKKCGLLVAGENPISIDLFCSKVIGFDYKKIPIFKYQIECKKYPLMNTNIEDIEIINNNGISYNLHNVNEYLNYKFKPSRGWKGHIEIDNNINR